jgi:hypothetical protein
VDKWISIVKHWFEKILEVIYEFCTEDVGKDGVEGGEMNKDLDFNDTRGKICYDAYCKELGFEGKFESLHDTVRKAWSAAFDAANEIPAPTQDPNEDKGN